jgi:hypothetical protein
VTERREVLDGVAARRAVPSIGIETVDVPGLPRFFSNQKVA